MGNLVTDATTGLDILKDLHLKVAQNELSGVKTHCESHLFAQLVAAFEREAATLKEHAGWAQTALETHLNDLDQAAKDGYPEKKEYLDGFEAAETYFRAIAEAQ